MNRLNRYPKISNRNYFWLFILIFSAALGALMGPNPLTPRSVIAGPAPVDAPLVAFRSPRDGMALNAPGLHVEDLLAAVKSDPKSSFGFNGQTVPGKNDGHIDHVLLSIDNILVKNIDTHEWGSQIVVDSKLGVSTLTSGLHLLTISAFPEGLQFAWPATLTLDFSATGQTITTRNAIFCQFSGALK